MISRRSKSSWILYYGLIECIILWPHWTTCVNI